MFTTDWSNIGLFQPGGHGVTMGAPTVDPVAVREGLEGVEIIIRPWVIGGAYWIVVLVNKTIFSMLAIQMIPYSQFLNPWIAYSPNISYSDNQ